MAGGFQRSGFQNSGFQTDASGGGGKHRLRVAEVEYQKLPGRPKKRKKPIRPVWDRPLVEAPVKVQRAPEFPPILPAPIAVIHQEPYVPTMAVPAVSGIPYPSPNQMTANVQDMQDAQDALAALGVMFDDDQEVGDAMAALAAAGLL